MYRRGSVLITVIFTMLIVFALGLSLLSIAGKNIVMSRMDVDSTSAYYIAECGITRASTLIENDTRKIISDVIQSAQDSYNSNKLTGVRSPDDLNNFIIDRINAEFLIYLNPFKEGSFYKKISQFHKEGGIDGRELTARTAPEKSYYTVTIDFSPFDWNDRTHRKVEIVSTGYCGKAIRTVKSDFFLDYPFSIIEVMQQYDSLPEFLNSSLSVIGGGSQEFDSCSIICDGDILTESKNISFKNSIVNTPGKIILKGKNIDLYNNVKLSGIPVFDYDNIAKGCRTEINGNTDSTITDSLVYGHPFYKPMALPDIICNQSESSISPADGNSGTECSIRYIFYDKDAVVDNGIFMDRPDDVYVIISRGNLKILNEGSRLSFKGVVYCGGCLSIYSDDFSLSGTIICRKADLKGSIKIESSLLNPGQLDEIASAIKSSLLAGRLCVLCDYDFCCRGWQE